MCIRDRASIIAHRPIYDKSDAPPVVAPLKTVGDRLERLDVVGLTYLHPTADHRPLTAAGRQAVDDESQTTEDKLPPVLDEGGTMVVGRRSVVGGLSGIADAAFALPRGSFTVITGRVGSGKTTLLRALLGLLPPQGGEVRWNGARVSDPAAHFAPPRAAYTPQVPRLFSQALRDNILMGLPDDGRLAHAPVSYTHLDVYKRQVLGMELAGDIDAVGQDVTRFKVGDPVFASTFEVNFGGYAEYKCFPEDGLVAHKPDNLNYEEAAAAVGAGMTALRCLRQGNIRPGQRVLIYGASGAVGTNAVQLARNHFGAEVTGVCSGANGDLVRSLGAAQVIDYTREDFTRRGEKYDVVFDAVARFPPARAAQALTETGVYLNVHKHSDADAGRSTCLLYTSRCV